MTVAICGDHGTPRPALVVQPDAFSALPSVTLPQLSSDIQAEHLVRVTVPPTLENGLRATSRIMIDKAVTVPHERIGTVIERLDDVLTGTGGRALVAFPGLEM